MALGFDFNELMNNPLFQMGIGMLAQPNTWENRGFAGVAQGALQGLGNYQQYQSAGLLNKLRQQQLTTEQAQTEQQKQQLAARQAFVQRMRAETPLPRPLAFTPQPGDQEVAQNYKTNMNMADAVAAGMPLTEVFNYQQKQQENAANREERGAQLAADRQLRKEMSDAQIEARHQDRQAQLNTMLETARMHGATMTQIAAIRADAMKANNEARVQDKITAGEDRLHKLYATDSAKIGGISDQINQVRALLQQPASGPRDLAIQSGMAKIFSAGRQAASEVKVWHNPGGVADRIVGGVTRFLRGKYGPKQIKDISNVLDELEGKVINPSLDNLDTRYTTTAKSRGYNPENVVIGGRIRAGSPLSGAPASPNGWSIQRVQ